MKTLSCFASVWIFTAAAWCQDPPNASQSDLQASKLIALEKVALSYVNAYNKADPAALAALFLPEGELVLAGGELLSGREAIQSYYQEAFSRAPKFQAALEAGSVRFVAPGVAMEDGDMHFTATDGQVISHAYKAVHLEQPNGSWLTASVREEGSDDAPAAEKLGALQWMIGDWIVQKDGADTFVTFDWSQEGPFIRGRALTEQADADSAAFTYQIGWDPSRKGFVSWAFDARGGFNQSEWVAAGENRWLLRTHGTTADGEANQATQILALDSSRQFFTWSSRDQTLGDELQPEKTFKVVKRPPSLESTGSTAE